MVTADNTTITVDNTSSVMTTFDRVPNIALETIFDAGSLRFISPVDVYDGTDSADRYIKFPDVKIINNIQ